MVPTPLSYDKMLQTLALALLRLGDATAGGAPGLPVPVEGAPPPPADGARVPAASTEKSTVQYLPELTCGW